MGWNSYFRYCIIPLFWIAMKSPYSKFKRWRIYHELLEIIQSIPPLHEPLTDENWFQPRYKWVNFCLLLEGIDSRFDIEDFPELMNRKPKLKLKFVFWFHPCDHNSRIIILEEAIVELNLTLFDIIFSRH